MSEELKPCELCEDLTLVYMTGYSKAANKLLADPTPEEIEAVGLILDNYGVALPYEAAQAALTKFIELRRTK